MTGGGSGGGGCGGGVDAVGLILATVQVWDWALSDVQPVGLSCGGTSTEDSRTRDTVVVVMGRSSTVSVDHVEVRPYFQSQPSCWSSPDENFSFFRSWMK